jgi:hypothetical protein
MNCDNIKGKLPEYLAGILNKDESANIKNHLDQCASCGKEVKDLKDLKDLNEEIPIFNNKEVDMNKVLKKTSRQFKFKMFSIVILTIGVLCTLYLGIIAPSILWVLRSVDQEKASRVFMDAIQFSVPEKVNSWGNSDINRISFSIPLNITTIEKIGKSYGKQNNYKGRMSVVSGDLTLPPLDTFTGADFIYPKLFPNA